MLLLTGNGDSSPPRASESHVCQEHENMKVHENCPKIQYSISLHMSVCDNLVFGELSPQAAHVLGHFQDPRFQTGGVSHLWILLVHTLHLLQGFTENSDETRREKC